MLDNAIFKEGTWRSSNFNQSNPIEFSIVFYVLFKMLVEVARSLECIQRNFLREGNSNRKKMHLLKCNKLVKPKKLGGLGLGGLVKKELSSY